MHRNPPLMRRFFDNKEKEAAPAPVFVKIGRKWFPVPACYGGRLAFDQETCSNMWTICKSRTHKEMVSCMSNPVKAKVQWTKAKSM